MRQLLEQDPAKNLLDYTVMGEDRKGELELVAIERPLRFTDDDCIEATLRHGQRRQQLRRLRPSLPRDRAALCDVEELRNDLPANGLDELSAAM